MTLLDKTNTLIIVPAYNEQDSIVAVIEEIKATGFPFVVIDDGSTDETRTEQSRLAPEPSHFHSMQVSEGH